MRPVGDSRVPSPGECLRILEEYRVPAHIRRHSEKVAAIACRLGAALNADAGSSLDLRLLEAAALLHDIVKLPSLEKRRDHAKDGGRLLRSLGFPDIADLVEQHVVLRSPGAAPKVGEAEILNYSDKRVLHEDVVSLTERFDDLLVRYGRGRRGVDEIIKKNREVIEALEKEIFAGLPFGPGEIAGW